MKPGVPIRFLVLVTLTCAVTCVTPSIASAFGPFPEQFGPEAFGVYQFGGRFEERDGSANNRAGSHPYGFTTTVVFNHTVTNEAEVFIKSPKGLRGVGVPEIAANLFGSPKHLRVNLPPGAVVNPNAVPEKCTEAQFETAGGDGGGCPIGSIVGVDIPLISELYAPASVYDLVPPSGVAAEFGVNPGGIGLVVHIVGKVRTNGAYELSGEAEDITPKVPLFGNELILWGDPTAESHDAYRGVCVSRVKVEKEVEEELVKLGKLPSSAARVNCPLVPGERTGKPLLTMPGSCTHAELDSTLSTSSWQEPTNPIEPSAPNTTAHSAAVTGCEALHFNPSLAIRPETEDDSESAESPSGLSVDLHFPLENLEENEGLTEANLKKATVTLPPGFAVSPSSANGLGVCTPGEIGLHNADKPSCPDSSKVGSAEVTTPLLDQPLKGEVYLAQQETFENSLIALYIVVEGPGALVKLGGKVSLDPNTGQITTTFDNNPQLPFSDLKLKFFSGPRAPLVTPSVCGTYAGSAQLTPWSGNPPLEASTGSFTISSNCNHPFSPSMVAGSTSLQAGGYTPFSLTLARQDGEQRFSSVTVAMPHGLLANLKSVPLCPEPQAAQGECPETSLIGETTASAGPGPDPFWVKGGKVYLTGPYDGAPFGLSIAVPAIAGPFNLGTVIARAAISVDRNTAQAIITSQIPTIKDGIPLDVRTINVTVDRPGFVFNPTNCTPTAVATTLESDTHTRTTATSPFDVVNCAQLPFAPSFKASTAAKTSKASGASLVVKVGSGSGQANMAKARVTLPKQLPARLTTLQKACTEVVFNANPAACPVASRVGIATAVTPILAHPLTGPAYLVSHGGAAFPDLVFVLQGEGITDYLDGNTNIKKGITTSTFNSVPDAPISMFETVFPQGPTSVLATDLPSSAHNSMCGQKLTMPTVITGQNGAVTTQATKIQVTGCPKAKKAKKTKKAAHRKK